MDIFNLCPKEAIRAAIRKTLHETINMRGDSYPWRDYVRKHPAQFPREVERFEGHQSLVWHELLEYYRR